MHLREANKQIYTSQSHIKLDTSAFLKHQEQPIKPVFHNPANFHKSGFIVYWLIYKSEVWEPVSYSVSVIM